MQSQTILGNGNCRLFLNTKHRCDSAYIYNHTGLYLSIICKDSHQYYGLTTRTQWNIHTGFPKSLHSNCLSVSAYYCLHQHACPYQSLSSKPISTQISVQLRPMHVSLVQCGTAEIRLCICITKDLKSVQNGKLYTRLFNNVK